MKLVTTLFEEGPISFLLDEKDHLLEIHPHSEEINSLVGNIYLGRVMNIVKNIQAAFIHIGLKENVYLSLENTTKVYTPTGLKQPSSLKQGDLILVQVIKDAHKTKAPKVATEFVLTGLYGVLTTDHPLVGLSTKIIHKHDRLHLKKVFSKYVTKDFGFIVRTNCLDVSDDIIEDEIKRLIDSYEKLIERLRFSSPMQCLHHSLNSSLKLIRDLNHDAMEQYVYDVESLYLDVRSYMEENLPEEVNKCRYYQETYSLRALFNLDKQLERAMKEKVWLKSGASIIIQPTEALTVIDVNTEKSNSTKMAAETILFTNKEAAIEIARQVRLRNLSGIIIIDFIDMAEEAHKEELCSLVQELCQKDRIKMNFIDMTPLGLVEITRKKTERTLAEKMAGELGKKS